MIIVKSIAAAILTAGLVACGGGASDSSSATNPGGTEPPTTTAPGGIYVGYYREDAATNPEDPTVGALYLNLPTADSDFAGSMSFTYVGCQSFNVGAIRGNKSGLDLVGTWSGSVDGRPQNGQYTGRFNTEQAAYQGTYTNSGGKQFVDVQGCIQYFIGPNGTWELFSIGQTVSSAPTATGVIIEGNQITWYPPAGSVASMLSIIDQSIAASGGANAIVWQNLYNAGIATASVPPAVTLERGRQYVLSAGSLSADGARNYFSSTSFTAP